MYHVQHVEDVVIGTGPVPLDLTSSSYVTLYVAAPPPTPVAYVIRRLKGASQWEYGVGELSVGGALVRTTITDNSAGNTNPIDFTGPVEVAIMKPLPTSGSVLVTTTSNWTVPVGVRVVYATLTGGGGAGGGADAAATAGSGGGSAGATILRYPIIVTPGEVLEVTIGAAGAPAVDANGGNGGATTVSYGGGSWTLTAPGGLGGVQATGATGGKGADSAQFMGQTANGGAGSSGFTDGFAGEAAKHVAPWALTGGAGGGGALNGAGGAGGSASAGWPGGVTYSGDTGSGGGGGASFFGPGNEGALGDGVSGSTPVQTAYGSGGGGSGGGGTSGTQGSAGVKGAVLFQY